MSNMKEILGQAKNVRQLIDDLTGQFFDDYREQHAWTDLDPCHTLYTLTAHQV